MKAFNTLPMHVMFAPSEANGVRWVLFVAGDDTDAVAVVQGLVGDMALFPIAIGPLAAGGRLMELGGPLNNLELYRFVADVDTSFEQDAPNQT